MRDLKPVPVPISQRWQDVRLRALPIFVFCSALTVLAILWQRNIAVPSLVAQAEPVTAVVNSYKPGLLTQLSVARFQDVKAGQVVGHVLPTDPNILASSLAVIQAEIASLRAGLRPVAVQQRAAMDNLRLRLDWVRDQTELAMARVNLQLAEAEFRRTEELYKQKIVAERTYE